jgi:hypothetical protein
VRFRLIATHNSCECVAAACWFLQTPKLLALKAQLDEAAKEQTSLAKQVSALQGERDRAAEQLKKLTAEKASMQKQLGSSADDINLLQVRYILFHDAICCALISVVVACQAVHWLDRGVEHRAGCGSCNGLLSLCR